MIIRKYQHIFWYRYAAMETKKYYLVFQQTKIFLFHLKLNEIIYLIHKYSICIMMREGIQGEIFTEPKGFSKGSLNIPTQVIIQILLISKKKSSSIVLSVSAIFEMLIFHIALGAGSIFFGNRCKYKAMKQKKYYLVFNFFFFSLYMKLNETI